jgi:hypothetical protein
MTSQICVATKGDGKPCTHNAKQEYGFRYCGTHRSTWEEEQRRSAMREQIGFHCGVDIGFGNLAITFLGMNGPFEGRIVSYIGSVDEMLRLEQGVEPSVIHSEQPKNTPMCEKVFELIDNIPEFKAVVHFIIERQPSLASAEGCRLDGQMLGYLRGKGLNGCYLDSRTRQNFTERECPEVSVEAKKKQFSISFVVQKYPTFYAFIKDKRKKIDDVCDSLIYAYMSSEALSSAKLVNRTPNCVAGLGNPK